MILFDTFQIQHLPHQLYNAPRGMEKDVLMMILSMLVEGLVAATPM